MKNYEKVIAIIVSMSVLTGTASSCAVSKKKVSLSSDETISAAVDPVSLKELPRGEYEVSEADYLRGIENISNILDTANIEYIKWDMNRHMSDIPNCNKVGEFYHR